MGGLGKLQEGSVLSAWVYGIATHVCLDMLRSTKRRALPMDLGAPSPGTVRLGTPLPESMWLQPASDASVMRDDGDPSDRVVARESIRLAFIAALQLLPPRQRAVLILRDVLRWRAAEVADLLETSTASVNSALQRARATLRAHDVRRLAPPPPDDHEQLALLARYVDAFERFDIDALVTLLHEDATLSMPPFALWLQGRAAIRDWFTGAGADCRYEHLVPVHANGAPGFAVYRPSKSDSRTLEAFSIQVLELSEGRISAIHAFLDPTLFPLFDLPTTRAQLGEAGELE